MSAIAGPALGLTSSTTESWVAPAPTAVNHWSATGGAQSTAASGAGLRAAGDQPGGEVVGARDDGGAGPRRRDGDPAGADPQRSRSCHRARPGRARDLRAGSTPERAHAERVGAGAGQRARADHRGRGQRRLDRRLGRPGCSRSGRAAAAPARTPPGAATARSTSAPNRRLIAGPLPGPGPCWARRAPAPRGSPSPAGRAARCAARTAVPRGPRADSGRSTCQARVAAVLGARRTRPPVASSAAATSPSAGAGRTTYSMPRAASVSTASGSGRETRPRTSAVKSRSSAVSAEHLVLAGGDAVVAAHRVGRARRRPSRGPRGSRARGRASELCTM